VRGNALCAVPSTLVQYLQGGGYMNFSGLLLSRAFLMWLRPTPLAPAEKERWMLEPGSEMPDRRCWGPLHSSGSEERWKVPRALPRICLLIWSMVSSGPGRGSPCPWHTHLQPQLETGVVPAEWPAWLGCVRCPCLRSPLTSAQHSQRGSACFGAAVQTRAAFNKNYL